MDALRPYGPGSQRQALLTVHQALQTRGQKMPDELLELATDLAKKFLASPRERQVTMGAELARQLKLIAVRSQLEVIATRGKFTAARATAIDACVACDPAGSVSMLAAFWASDMSRQNARSLLVAGGYPMVRSQSAQATPP